MRKRAALGERLANEKWKHFGTSLVTNGKLYFTVMGHIPNDAHNDFRRTLFQRAWERPGVIFNHWPHDIDDPDYYEDEDEDEDLIKK
jgi:hypothetical protein